MGGVGRAWVVHWLRTSDRAEGESGLVMKSSIPALRHFSRSPAMAVAVTAMIGRCRPLPDSASSRRTSRVVA